MIIYRKNSKLVYKNTEQLRICLILIKIRSVFTVSALRKLDCPGLPKEGNAVL
jgi:hypothetical protein